MIVERSKRRLLLTFITIVSCLLKTEESQFLMSNRNELNKRAAEKENFQTFTTKLQLNPW